MTKFQLLIGTILFAGAIVAQQTPAVTSPDGRLQTLGSQQGKSAVDPYAAKGPSTAPAPRTSDGKPDLSGRWDGDTLVVDTVGQNDKTWLDQSGIPHSTELHVIERIKRIDMGHMEIEHIVEDPKTFTKPWTFTTKPTLLPGELIEYICQENEKDVDHLFGK